MKMSPSDEKTYPKLHDYVKNRLPTVLNRTRIAKALRTVGRLSPKQAADALTYGNDPSITIVHIPTPVVITPKGPDLGDRTFGQFDEANPNAIEINKQLVLMFEFVHSGKLAFKVGVTLLHELVHWSTFHYHKAHGTVNAFEDAFYAGAAIGRNHELGDRFERAAYGCRSEHYDFMW